MALIELQALAASASAPILTSPASRSNLGGDIYTVTGVMPDDFDVPSQEDRGVDPAAALVSNRPRPEQGRLMVVSGCGRRSSWLMPSVVAVVARQLATKYPDTHRGMRIHLVPFFNEMIKDSRPLLLVASAAALLGIGDRLRLASRTCYWYVPSRGGPSSRRVSRSVRSGGSCWE